MQQTKIISNVSSPEKYVGFADLPNQIYRHYAMEGFDLNLMIVGESGLGKSTFINSLFLCDIYVNTKYGEINTQTQNASMEIRNSFSTITEKGVKLRLNLIDTPGYGSCLDNRSNWEGILNYINLKNKEYLDWELSMGRSQIRDGRVHCCLYFISPTGHRLKPIDVDFLSRVHDRVNIIIAIGRSDSLTAEDLIQFKKRITQDLEFHKIKTYKFPQSTNQSAEDKEKIESYLNRSPFAIVSSNTTIELKGKPVRCRQYPWGICEVENVQHSDFIPLRNLLLRTCTAHLINTTHTVFYEEFRSSNGNCANVSLDDSTYKVVEEEKSKLTTLFEATKTEYKEKYEIYLKEINDKLGNLSKEMKDRIECLNREIEELNNENSSQSSSVKVERENTAPDDKKKKKRLF